MNVDLALDNGKSKTIGGITLALLWKESTILVDQ